MSTNKEEKPKETNNDAGVPAVSNENEEGQGMLKDLEGDKLHVLLLFFLYLLQNLPRGLQNSILPLLAKRDIPLMKQAMFTIAYYPFSMKILWAPLIDSVYISSFGRRKSWLVPAQYSIGKGEYETQEGRTQEVVFYKTQGNLSRRLQTNSPLKFARKSYNHPNYF